MGLQELLTSIPSSRATSPYTRDNSGNAVGCRCTKQRFGRVLGAVIAVLLLVIIGWLNSSYPKQRDVTCDSNDCIFYGKLLDETLNATADPCHNFHEHVCSRRDAKGLVSLKLDVYRRFIMDVASVAERKAIPGNGQNAVEKAAKFYQSCIAACNGRAENRRALKRLLQDVGVRWPHRTYDHRLLDIILKMTARYNWGAVVQVLMDRPGSLAIVPSPFFAEVLRGRSFMLHLGSNQYRQYFNEMVKTFKDGSGEQLGYEEFLTLESEVVPKLSSTYTQPQPKILRNVSMKHVLSDAGRAVPRGVWVKSLRSHLNASVDETRVSVLENVDLFETLFGLVQSPGESLAVYYYGWILIQSFVPFGSADIVSYTYQTADDEKRGRARFCVLLAEAYMGAAFYASYAKDQMERSMTTELSSLATNVRVTFWSKIDKSLWPAAADAVVGYTNPSDGLDDSLHLIGDMNPEYLNATYAQFPDMKDDIFENIEQAVSARRLTEANTRMPRYMFERQGDFLSVNADGRLELLPLILEMPFFPAGAFFQGVKYGAVGGQIADALSFLFLRRIEELDANLSATASSIPCTLNNELSLGSKGLIREEDLDLMRRVSAIVLLHEAYVTRTRTSGEPLGLPKHEKLTEGHLFFYFMCLYRCGTDDANLACNLPQKVLGRFTDTFQCQAEARTPAGRQCSLFDTVAQPLL